MAEGQFPIQYSQATPSGQSGSVRANINVDTGAEAISRGLMQFSDTLMPIAERIYQRKAAADYSEGQRKIEETILSAFNSVSGDEEADAKLWEKVQEDLGKIQYKRPEVNAKLSERINQLMPDAKDTFDKKHLAIVQKGAKDRFEFELDDRLAKGDITGSTQILKDLYLSNAISKTEYEARLKNIPNDSLLRQMKLNFERGNYEVVLATKEILKDKDRGFTSDHLAYANNLIEKSQQEMNKSNDADKLVLYEKFETSDLTWDEVKATSLSPDDKISIWERYKDAQAERQKFGISMIQEGDPVVLAQVYAIVDLKPNDITPQQLYALADKGLGTKYIPSLVNRLKENQEVKNPVLNKYRSELTRLLNAELFGNKNKRSTSETYLRLSQKLETFLGSNPTDQQAGEFFSSLIKEDVRTFGLLNENMLPGFGDRPLTIDLKTPTGEERTYSISYGDTIEVEGELLQAVGRKDGVVQWRTVKRQ